MSKRVYKAVGGFPPYRLMDDFILVIIKGEKSPSKYWRSLNLENIRMFMMLNDKCSIPDIAIHLP